MSAARTDRHPEGDTLAVVGWVTAFFFPIVGAVCGAMLRSRGDGRGTAILIVSILMLVIEATIIIAIATSLPDDPVAASSGNDCIFNHNPTRAEVQDCIQP